MGWERRGSRVLILACVLIVRASCTGRAARRAHLVSMRVGDSRVTSLPSTATLAAGPTKQLLVCHGPRSAAMAPAAQGRMLLALGRALQLPCPAQQQHAWHQARAVATGAAAAAQGAGAGRSRPLLLTLERSVGGSLGSDSELRSTGAFGAEVFPDLPIATTWGNLWKVLRSSPSSSASTAAPASSAATASPLPGDVRQGALKVLTVAANLRSVAEVEQRMLRAAEALGPEQASSPVPDSPFQRSGATAGRPADALLMVSGSHPVRTLPGANRLLPTSLHLLDKAQQLKQQGRLPESLQLWAVANPNVEADASLVAAKVERGASVILTQPPFDMDKYEAWVLDAAWRGVWDSARLVVGHPMISSTSNLAFWLGLARCLGSKAPRELLAGFSAAEAQGGKAGLEAHCEAWNRGIVEKALGWSGTGGFHLMPITPRGKKATIALVKSGGLLHS